MTTINIGADELILWLRKNNKAVGKNTPDLGAKILVLIESLGGTKLSEIQCRWERSAYADGVDKLDLPKTATQYSIKSNQIGLLYETLNNW
ncbi:hypothetical protein RCH18_001700 [Flavobacterium sp. PL11]|uniref:hypothetical protein n=1 Tax=Flavobacterium sp. PL11 TaxID=3071717 RepID=UPI002DF94C57|nr:hypothetical protein [Flavobacterium sp. PL11]